MVLTLVGSDRRASHDRHFTSPIWMKVSCLESRSESDVKEKAQNLYRPMHTLGTNRQVNWIKLCSFIWNLSNSQFYPPFGSDSRIISSPKSYNRMKYNTSKIHDCLVNANPYLIRNRDSQTPNLLAPEFYIEILAHPIYKMWIIQEPKKVALWNKRHFEGKKTKSVQHV